MRVTCNGKSWLSTLVFSRVALILFCAGFFSVAGAVLFREIFINSPEIKMALISNCYAPFQRMKLGLFEPEVLPERIEVDIKHLDLKKIAYNREVALSRGYLLSDYRDEVPAKIRHNGHTYKANVRLKGDSPDHWIDKNIWSLKVRLKGGETLFGMRNFSLQSPERRVFLQDWVYQKLSAVNDLISLRFFFVELYVNGKYWGVVNVEEGFDKRLLENNDRREGAIIKFDDTKFWKDKIFYRINNVGNFEKIPLMDHIESSQVSPIIPYQLSSTLENPVLKDQYERGYSLLHRYMEGELSIEQVFDIDKLARFFAINHLAYNTHPSIHTNVRFYYNSIIDRLELIGSSTEGTMKCRSLPVLLQRWRGFWFEYFAQDRDFYLLFLSHLKQVCQKKTLDTFLEQIATQQKDLQKQIHISFPSYKPYDLEDILGSNQLYIQSLFDNKDCLLAYLSADKKDKIRIKVAMSSIFPGIVHKLVYRDSISLKPDSSQVELPYRFGVEPLKFVDVCFDIRNSCLPDDFEAGDFKLQVLRLPDSVMCSIAVEPYRQASNSDSQSFDEFVSLHDFLRLDEGGKVVSFEKGRWTIDQPVVIPAGKLVIVNEGTELDLVDRAKIISHSPLFFMGTGKNPIKVLSSDSSGLGITVLGCPDKSVFNYTYFERLSGNNAIDLFISDADFDGCTFSKIKADCTLNVFNAKLAIDRCLFTDLNADAINGSFAEVAMNEVDINQCGRNGIFADHSIFKMYYLNVENVKNTAFTAGRESDFYLRYSMISNCGVGVFGNSLSQFYLRDSNVEACQIGAVSLQGEKSPGENIVRFLHCKMADNVVYPCIVDNKGKLVLQDRPVEPETDPAKINKLRELTGAEIQL